jgi:hypothetical protein
MKANDNAFNAVKYFSLFNESGFFSLSNSSFHNGVFVNFSLMTSLANKIVYNSMLSSYLTNENELVFNERFIKNNKDTLARLTSRCENVPIIRIAGNLEFKLL